MTQVQSTVQKPARRSFLKGSAATAGGLSVAFVMPATMSEALAAGTLHTPTAWVHIADNNQITIISARSEMGQGVYTSMPMLVAEELGVDVRKVKVTVGAGNPAYANMALGAQITGGSTSVREGWERLRVAGAQVREMLVAAAAAKWNVDAGSLKVANGFVMGPGGKKASYGSLAAAASKLEAPKTPKLKDPNNFTIVGKKMARLDTPMKTNGTAEFGIDVKLPGMVYASLEQCPVIGGKVKSFDGAQAKGMPGVLDVVNIGDGVAVVASSYWQAFKARNTLKVEWDEGPVAALSDASMWAGMRKAAGEGKKFPATKAVGNVADAMKTAAKTVKAEYTVPLQAHQPLEPMNFTADWNGGNVKLIGPTQFQQGALGAVAATLGVKPENVSLRTTFLGGGFGRRIELDFIVQAALISKAVNKPVKLLWSREDDMTHDFYRPQGLNQLEAGLGADGMPVAYDFKVTSQSITQRAFGLPKDTFDAFMAEASVPPYEIPNMDVNVVIHDTGYRMGYWRAVSHNMNCFATESFFDECAKTAGKDPVEYRMAMVKNKPRFANVLKMAADKAGWSSAPAAGRARGVALMEGYDSYLALVAEISAHGGEIKVHKVTAVADVGRMVNPETVEAQLFSAVNFGMSAALHHQITVDKGRVQQRNFNDFPVVRMNESPEFNLTLVQSTEKPGGIGEPATAMIGPAIANAYATLTGKRIRSLPLSKDVLAKA